MSGVDVVQGTFDELGRPLADVTFCVVDLETTGGSAAKGARITEIGAVKVRGGEVVGELQTLVDPGGPIPAFITVLTGITDAMVCQAPAIDEVLPSFLEFAHGCVLVAHNAPFDVGFLKHAAKELGHDWPRFEVLDTVTLARRALLRDEVRNHKLETLARHFGSPTTPNHRALEDARATVHVLHALFERLGGLGVHTLEEVSTYTKQITDAERRKRHLADHLPAVPGVYLFRDRAERVLYVGTSRNIRTRARTYFTGSETRRRMREMVRLAERIEGIECATALEAQVRELRLIARHTPPYNRRSRFPDRLSWVKLTREPWPRLSIVRKVIDDDADYVGPFRDRRRAEEALAAAHDAFRVRQCTGRLPVVPRGTPCVLAEMDHCLSPCDGSVDADTYAAEVARLRETLVGEPLVLIDHAGDRMRALAAAQRFEDAAVWRDRLSTFLRGAARAQRLRQLTAEPEVVAARRGDTGWEMHVIRHGRLAAAGVMPPRGVDQLAWIETLVAGAETVEAGFGPAPAATVEETEVLLRWLESDGVRMVRGTWQCRASGAQRHLAAWTVEPSGSRGDAVAAR